MTTKITNCQFCGQDHGVQCPSVKEIEYFEDGKTVKRVVFRSGIDNWVPPLASGGPVWPFLPPQTSVTYGHWSRPEFGGAS
jgi:hypothetical protein